MILIYLLQTKLIKQNNKKIYNVQLCLIIQNN